MSNVDVAEASVAPSSASAGASAATRYIYIASRGHSGSTLLELVLGGHPELLPVGEIEKLSLQLAREVDPYPGMCSCGRRPYDCERWRTVIEAVRRERGIDLVAHPFGFRVSDIGREQDFGKRALSHWLLYTSARVSRYVAYSPAGWKAHLPAVVPFAKRWVENRLFVTDVLLRTTGARGIIDSSKDPLGMRDLATYCTEQLKVIFLTRDPRASVYSTVRNGKRGVESAAQDWVSVNSKIVGLLRGVDRGQWAQVRYEDLCADPAGTCERLCAFLGYSFDRRMLDLRRADQHTIGGNRIRFKPIGQITLDEKWRHGLKHADVRRINEITKDLARALGYDVRPEPSMTASA